ncbi:redox-sensitive transcriptional activator SoxR [Mesobacterium pallidum]|uniref:redox-sensitive transcriptional activator SoxR n=1 Tax=Mesobacterium pallidum TaxID=2872037 RepID=UPI001EE2D500|nr:redox-sensitive transcriptional activator SoxR [Mesobacterium pallidum]
MKATDILSIGAVAERTGLAVSALRYYEEFGLITPMRAPNGQRRFRRADLRRLAFVQVAQGLGFGLPRIREVLADLPDGRPPNARDWKKISAMFRAELDQRIATLETLRDDLDGCIGCGCLSMERCALYNARDKAAKKGSGARYLMGDRSSEVPEVG